VSENRVLRNLFGSKWEEITGDWRRLHNEELHLGNQAKEKERGMAYGMYWGEEKCI
jgi:hypothetical protein